MKNQVYSEIEQEYFNFMKNYNQQNESNIEWLMKDGMFVQYSAYECNYSCTSGTSQFVKAL